MNLSGLPPLPPALRRAYPWNGQTLAVNGGQLHYIDEGPKDAPVMLCLHGNPTWSFYWRRLVQHFAGAYRVVVPDHIGCGLSEKPQGWGYRLDGHIGNVVRLMEHLDLTGVTLVVHDWGGAIGMGAAARVPERVAKLVITNTAAYRSNLIPRSINSVRIPGFGALAVRGGNAFARAATRWAVTKPLEPVAREGLVFPYSSWANRIATLRFVQDIPMWESHPSYGTLAEVEAGLETFIEHPMLLLWGERDFCFTNAFRDEWTRRFPSAVVHSWPDVGHYVMEDAPERVIEAMTAFLEPA